MTAFGDFDKISTGDSASVTRKISVDDIRKFVEMTGDDNPLHVDKKFAASTPYKDIVVHGMLGASFISTVIGTRLPGHGSIYMSQSLRFRAPVRIGDKVLTAVQVTAVDERRNRVMLACSCRVEDQVVLDGDAMVMVPSRGPEVP